MLGRMGRVLLVGLMLLLAAPLARAQESDRPLTEGEFIGLVNAKTPEEKLIEIVRARGLAFTPSTDLKDGLVNLKLRKLLEAITAPATVELEVGVSGADVLVDGVKRGSTPPDGRLTLSGLEPGERRLTLRAPDYIETAEDVFLKPGEAKRVAITLRPAVTVTPGPLGSRVSVAAGTPADAALGALDFAQTPQARIDTLKKIVADFSLSPVAQLANEMLQQTYLSETMYDEALAAGEQVLERDPRHFRARVRQAHAYLGKGELEKGVEATTQARQLMVSAQTSVPPMGSDPDAWQREKNRSLEAAQGEWASLAYTAFVALSQAPDPARKRPLLEQFIEIFPDSAYKGAAFVQLAVTAQQLGDVEGTLRWAHEGLEANPHEGTLLVLAADVLSDAGKDLARARELATRLIELIQDQPDKVRPEGLADEQWAAQQRIWHGLALSALGYVNMHEGKGAAAIEEFRAAAPFLEGQAGLQARNLYRLGYALASAGGRTNLQEAQKVLSQVAAMGPPYGPPARDLLTKVEAALGPRR